jgi:hypothetical protein
MKKAAGLSGGRVRREKRATMVKGSLTGLVILVVSVSMALVLASRAATSRGQTTDSQSNKINLPPDFMGVAGLSGWVLAGPPRTFLKEGLGGYIDGGSEIFLQYGFRNLAVFDLVPERPGGGKKAITLEICRMDSPKAAFGIFSTRREGNERISPKIRTLHWIGPEQANMVMGDFYVNILAKGCTTAEIEEFAASLAANLPPKETPLPEGFSCMPAFDLVPRTERYIFGAAAAAKESPLLDEDFWGFKEGLTEAYSAEYGPRRSKLILIHFRQPPQDLMGEVYQLLKEHATDVSISDNIMQGGTPVGGSLYFGQDGPTGALILGEPDPKIARARIQDALNRAAKQLGGKPAKAPGGRE